MARRVTAAVLVLGLLGLGVWVSVKKTAPSELHVYVLGAERLMRGEAMYRVGEPKPFTYPPFFALVFVPFAALPEPWHKSVFFLANAAMLVVVLWRIEAMVRPPPGRRVLFWSMVAVVAGWHVNTVFEK